ncbi:heavy-metal-associated domain-containing protein [Halobacillus seohaensis]|uniref:Heavy-metal-associated domain-containing protein n=1 Tax=Halobacillus seohaensis TaxID=447421 RepID=A0ABW2EPD4_9BACI
MKEVTIQINGMTSSSDVEKVNEALYDVWGIREADISSKFNKVTFSYNEEAGSLVDFMQAIRDSGFEPIQEDE